MFAFEIIWHTDMSLPLLMSDLSNLFTCQFCTCSLDYGCCILHGNLSQRDPRRRKWKKYVPFLQYSLCICIAQLICCVVCHVIVLQLGVGPWGFGKCPLLFRCLVLLASPLHLSFFYLLFWTFCHLISIS
jgi:hypothetical protein